MRRLHLIELHDLAGFPAAWRDFLTDFLSFYASKFKPYSCVGGVLAEALRQTGTARIVDLGSGAGLPVLSVAPQLRSCGATGLEIVLTDKYPNVEAWAALERYSGAMVSFEAEPVDAADVPDGLRGFRTLFTSFHHFSPDAAAAVLSDAVTKGQGIGVFEYTERNLLRWGLQVCSIPLLVWIFTPFIRPVSWRRLVWTYLLPVVPIVAMWDGLVSCLRTYSTDELRDLIEGLSESSYRWDIGRVRSIGLSRVTYAVGVPADSTADDVHSRSPSRGSSAAP